MAKHYLMAKHILSMSNNKLYEGTTEITFAKLYAMLLEGPDFVVLVYNDRSYHPTTVKDPDDGDTKWRVGFVSPIIDGVTTKTAEIECESSDGITISKITTTAVNNENVSNKTDDVSGNSTSTTKYPSTKGVADYVSGGFLPLAGGTLIGNLYFGNGYGRILANNEFVQLQSTSDIGETANRRRLQIYNSNSTVVTTLEQSLKYIDTSYGTEKQYALFGEHNLIISATSASDDMDAYMKQGAHFKWYRTGSNTLNTPYKKGLTGGYLASVIMSYATSATVGKQIAYISGTDKVYVRYMNNDNPNVISDWQELGGGGMRVPIAIGQTDLVNQNGRSTLSLTGKGTVWINSGGNSQLSPNVTITIDGETVTNNTTYLQNTINGESFPLDFTKSIIIKNNYSSALLYCIYELYK